MILNPLDFAWNRAVHRLRPGRKIFFLGFNKCATSALDRFLRLQGVRSAHWQVHGENLAAEIEKRVERPEALAAWLGRWTAYSDLTLLTDEALIEGNRHFRLFHGLYPDAWFVLNDRDPDRWVASRLAHRDGSFARRSAAVRGCTVEQLPAIWLEERARHHRAVLDHFEGSQRFLHFRVDEDDIARLTDFLAPDFRLKPRHWRTVNARKAA